MNDLDFLENALRQSRARLPDAGFSQRVEKRVRQEWRRQRVIRALPSFMAVLGTFTAGAVTGFADAHLAANGSGVVDQLASLAESLAPLARVFAGYGLKPWMLLSGAATLVLALSSPGRDRPSAFRF